VTLNCPFCGRVHDTSELRLLPNTGGGFRCPSCEKTLRFYQPYRILRFTISILISAIIVRLAGVRSVPIFVGVTAVLWIPISLFANAYFVHLVPLTAVPWKPRRHTKTKTLVEAVNEKNATIELFEKSQTRTEGDPPPQ
jgi:hypothetical protein